MTKHDQLGKYRILEELGKGGFATVYRALDTTLDREVALKVLDPLLMRDEKWVKHFRQEAKTVAALEHPHIVGIYEIGEMEDRLYIAMTLAKGGSLAQLLASRGHLPWPETLAVLQPVCEALDYAHGQGVVHRDLKPANVLLDPSGPLLTDFGFARLLVNNSMSMSLSGGILGTPAYIAPEIWEYDHAEVPADVYALGCITYEMLLGEPLFGGKTPMQVMRAHDKGPQFAETWPEDVPTGLATILRKALARKPETRYSTAGSFWYALNDLEAQAEAAVEEGEWRAAKMAVGRWLAVTPDDAEAQTLQKEIEQRLRQSKTPTDPLEKPYQYLQRLLADQRWAEAQRQAQAILAKDPHYRDVADLAQQIDETRVNAQSGEARSSAVGGSQQLMRTQQKTFLQVLAVTVAVVILGMVAYVGWGMFRDNDNGNPSDPTAAATPTATVEAEAGSAATNTPTPSPAPAPTETAQAGQPTSTPAPSSMPTNTNTPIPDADNDGVPDATDACPTTIGDPQFAGCPDTDGDTIPDPDDACPNVAGLEEFQGCPDRDGDGIPDPQDTCPDQPAPDQPAGCPPGNLTTTPTNTSEPSLSPNGLILDIVTKHGSDPVPNLLVELRDESGTVLETGRTNGQGILRVYDVLPGSYRVWYPEDPQKYNIYTFGQFDLEGNPGDVVTREFPVITLDLEIIEPMPDDPVGPTPILKWKPYPGATRYDIHVWVESGEIWDHWLLAKDTQVQVSKPLEAGNTYSWAVYGYTADGTMIAVSGFGPSHELNFSQ